MEKFQELSLISQKKIHVADHILTQTYPLVQDPKLLLAVIENLYLALDCSMSSLLYYERLFKRIPAFTDNFESKFDILKNKCLQRHNLDQNYLTLIRNIKEIVLQHKNSPIEFSRKDKFVICSDNYKMQAITTEQMKKYINQAKLFIQTIDTITAKNKEMFA